MAPKKFRAKKALVKKRSKRRSTTLMRLGPKIDAAKSEDLKSSHDTPLKEFPIFGKLPIELRFLIWSLVPAELRIIHVEHKITIEGGVGVVDIGREVERLTASLPASGTLWATRESRMVALKSHEVLKSRRGSVFINWDVDTLFISPCRPSEDADDTQKSIYQKCQSLATTKPLHTPPAHLELFRFLAHFKVAKEVKFFMHPLNRRYLADYTLIKFPLTVEGLCSKYYDKKQTHCLGQISEHKWLIQFVETRTDNNIKEASVVEAARKGRLPEWVPSNAS